MRHLHGTLQGFRLFGEIGASEWPIFLTETQARSRLRFKVGYLSAVSAAPAASSYEPAASPPARADQR